MKGAHCLVCKEQGPDLVVNTSAPVPSGITALLDFTCGTCQRRWSWRATSTANGWVYVAVMPAPTRPGWGTDRKSVV